MLQTYNVNVIKREYMNMKNKLIGKMILELRNQKNMTQLELATLMNVTDKAVSK